MFWRPEFGIEQARSVATEPEAHLPTLRATLKALGVANVVRAQVQKVVARYRATIAAAKDAIAGIRVRDAADEKRVIEKITKIRAARTVRAGDNAADIAAKEMEVRGLETAIADLRILMERFA